MAVTVLWSPIAYYRSRLAEAPAWGSALLPVALHTVCTATATGVTLTKVQNAVEGSISGSVAGALAVFSAIFGVAVAFWLSTGGMVAIDKLCNGYGDTRRLIEFSAIAYLVADSVGARQRGAIHHVVSAGTVGCLGYGRYQ